MNEIQYKTIFQFRRGSTEEWKSVNPILRSGEPAWDSTLRKMKIGDGITNWKDLPYQENELDDIDIINCGNAII